ncbi:MAG: hypothetical protein KJZ93_12495 [Caldilineaceae bacterium]|nr:hypothetical protein [Caldilineaceae bacterium]
MPSDQPHPRTHLFTVRLWVERYGDDQREVRMQVRHVLSGETRYFRAWSEVVAFLLAKMQSVDVESREESGDHREGEAQ